MNQPTIVNARLTRRALFAGGAAGLAAIAGISYVVVSEDDTDDDPSSQVQIGVLPGSPTTLVGGVPVIAAPVDSADSSARSVAMIGDSITAGSEPSLRYILTAAGIPDLVIDGVTSRRIEVGSGKGEPLSGDKTLYTMLAAGTSPDVWVFALGTNDAGAYATGDEYGALIDSMLDMISDDVPVVWVDIWRFDHVDGTDMFNDVLRRRIDDRGNAVVVSWHDIASQSDQTVLRNDGIHPNLDGQAVFAQLVLSGIEQVT